MERPLATGTVQVGLAWIAADYVWLNTPDGSSTSASLGSGATFRKIRRPDHALSPHRHGSHLGTLQRRQWASIQAGLPHRRPETADSIAWSTNQAVSSVAQILDTATCRCSRRSIPHSRISRPFRPALDRGTRIMHRLHDGLRHGHGLAGSSI